MSSIRAMAMDSFYGDCANASLQLQGLSLRPLQDQFLPACGKVKKVQHLLKADCHGPLPHVLQHGIKVVQRLRFLLYIPFYLIALSAGSVVDDSVSLAGKEAFGPAPERSHHQIRHQEGPNVSPAQMTAA